MEKRIITRDFLNGKELISTEKSMNRVYKVSNKEVLKIFRNDYFNMYNLTNMPLEDRILNATFENNGIVIPTAAAYAEGRFVGYFQPYIEGITESEYDDNLTIPQRIDLYQYARHYLKLEKIIKNSPNIVIPDLLTCENILVQKNGNLKLIDYDAMQVNESEPIIISSNLNENQILSNKKYQVREGVFTKQLDIKSLTHMYFLGALNTDLSMVGEYHHLFGKITPKDVLNTIGLDDPEITNKICNLFSEDKENEYLGEDVLKIAEKYKINLVYANDKEKVYLKRLVKR